MLLFYLLALAGQGGGVPGEAPWRPRLLPSRMRHHHPRPSPALSPPPPPGQELKEEEELFSKFESDDSFREEVVGKLRQHGKVRGGGKHFIGQRLPLGLCMGGWVYLGRPRLSHLAMREGGGGGRCGQEAEAALGCAARATWPGAAAPHACRPRPSPSKACTPAKPLPVSTSLLHPQAPERYYDAVMMRNELEVLKAKHAAGQ